MSLTVKTASGALVENKQTIIQVSDPDVVYSGINTTCISDTNANDFIGCPTGATLVATDDITKMASYVGNGKRVLLRRGSTWTSSSSIAFPNGSGPTTIGAYGTGNKPHITLGPEVNTFIYLTWKSDWRIMDLHVTGAAISGSRGIRGNNPINHMLVMNNELDKWDYDVLIQNWRIDDTEAHKNKNIFLVGNTLAPGLNLGALVGGEHLAIMGNDMTGGGQHTLRVYYSYLGVISHNLLSGAGHNGTEATGYGGHTLKFHGPDETAIGSYSETGNSGFPHRSQFTVVRSNVFGSAGDYQVVVGPQSTSLDHDERLSDIIIDENKFLADFGLKNKNISYALVASGSYYSICNNIFDGAGTTGGYRGILLRGNTYGPTTGHLVSGNKVYRGDALTITWDEFGVEVSSSIMDSTVKDSYVSFPNSTGNQLAVSNESTSTTLSNNILTTSPTFTEPDASAPLSRDFSLSE